MTCRRLRLNDIVHDGVYTVVYDVVPLHRIQYMTSCAMFEIPYHTRCRVLYHILTYDFIYYVVYTYDIVGHIVGQDTVLANRTYDIIGHVVIEISLEIVFFVNA